MASAKGLEALVQNFGLQRQGNLAVDLLRGCPVSLEVQSNNNCILVEAFMPERIFEARKTEMHQQLKAVKLAKCAYNKKKNRVVFTISNSKKTAEQYEIVRQMLIQYAVPYASEEACPYCGQMGCDMAGYCGGSYRRVHARCHHLHMDEQKDTVVTGRGNLLTGIIGSVGGSLAFMALALVILMLTDKIYGWLFVLATFASVGGYKLLKGPYGLAGTVTVAVSSLASMVLYLFFQAAYLLAVAYDMPFTEVLGYPGDVVTVAFSPDVLASCWFQLLFFLGGFLYCVIKRPLSQQKVLNELDGLEAFNRSLTEDESGL